MSTNQTNFSALSGILSGISCGGADPFPPRARINKEAIRHAILELFDDPDFVDQIQWKLALHEPKEDEPKT